MDVRFVSPAGVELCDATELPALLGRTDGLVWVDIPKVDAEAVRVLGEVFRFHPLAIQDCENRNHVPKVHLYPDHVFVALHSPELGKGGHVHHLELDLHHRHHHELRNALAPGSTALARFRATFQ